MVFPRSFIVLNPAKLPLSFFKSRFNTRTKRKKKKKKKKEKEWAEILKSWHHQRTWVEQLMKSKQQFIYVSRWDSSRVQFPFPNPTSQLKALSFPQTNNLFPFPFKKGEKKNQAFLKRLPLPATHYQLPRSNHEGEENKKYWLIIRSRFTTVTPNNQ